MGFPFLESLKRFLAPLWVFILGMIFFLSLFLF